MPDPRATPQETDIGVIRKTYIIDNSTITYSATAANGSTVVGRAVTFSADQTVQLVGDGEFVLGKLIQVFADNRCIVATHGTMTLPGGTSATLTRGNSIVGDLLGAAEGYIREQDGSTAGEIQAARGFIENDDATNPVVTL